MESEEALLHSHHFLLAAGAVVPVPASTGQALVVVLMLLASWMLIAIIDHTTKSLTTAVHFTSLLLPSWSDFSCLCGQVLKLMKSYFALVLALSLLLSNGKLTVKALQPWPMGGHDTRRSGQSEYVGSQSEYLAWSYNGSGTNLGKLTKTSYKLQLSLILIIVNKM